MNDAAARLEALRSARQQAFDAGRDDPLVAGPEHTLLAQQVAAEIRGLVKAADDLAALVSSWQFLAGMCGLFDGLAPSERPAADWRLQIEQALALVEEATA